MKVTSCLFLAAFVIYTLQNAQGQPTNNNSLAGIFSKAETPGVVQTDQQVSTRQLVALVKDASALVSKEGEKAFTNFRAPGSRWRQGESYIFVLDTKGNMLVHADPEMENENQLDLKDVNGKPIIRGLIKAASAVPTKPEGWYHYQWPVPGGLIPRWKSSYVQLVKATSGKSYIIGSGLYTDRMERKFVEDMVKDAVADVEKNKEAAFKLFQDPTGPYMVKDSYIFVIDPKGVELVNPAFPNLEGRNLLELKDTQGKFLVKEMLRVVQASDSGWVNYMWPKPGESVSTQKSTYVSKAKTGDNWLMVGAGMYLADAPKAVEKTKKLIAPELMALVRDAATDLEKRGEKAFPDFRKKGSRWFSNDTYLFVWSMDGTRVFHAADSLIEGKKIDGTMDIHGRPYGKMFLEAANSPEGEGWVHYMFPEPGNIFPAWKSSFVKRVKFPDGRRYLVGSGIYNMQMDKAFVEDLVSRAALLVQDKGEASFNQLRDKKGSFYFMDTYVFIDNPEGVELVNPAQPSLEGKNLSKEKDLKGKLAFKDYIDLAMKKGNGWTEYYWYKPGDNAPALKYTYVRKVQHGSKTYIVGSGYYQPDEEKKTRQEQKTSSRSLEKKE